MILFDQGGTSKIIVTGGLRMKKGFIMKFSLLSISLVLTSAMSIAATIPLMKETFATVPLQTVEMITTIPSLMVIVFVLLSVPISNRIGSKHTVILGLIIALIAGIIPAFSNNIIIIIASRFFLGAGFGMFNSLAISMIGDFFDGEQRIKLIGFQSAFQGLGSALLTFFAGQLMKIDWHMAYLVYLIIIPILVLFIIFVPNPTKKEVVTSGGYLQKEILNYCLLMFLVAVIFNAVFVKTPTLLTSKNIASAYEAGQVLTMIQIASMLTGFMFSTIFKKIKEYILTFTFIIMTMSYAALALSESLIIITIAAIGSGVAFSLFIPYLFNRVGQVANLNNQTFSTTLIIVSSQLGGFISPYILSIFSRVPILSSSISQTYLTCAFILTFLTILFYMKTKKKNV